MSGEDQRNLEAVEPLRRVEVERLDRAAQRLVTGQRSFAPAVLAMQLLGEVHHPEVQPKRAQHVDRVVGFERVEHGIDLFIELRSGGRAPLTGEQAQPFDVFERAGPRVRLQHLAHQPAEVRDARAQRRRGVALVVALFFAPAARAQNQRGTASR